MIEWVGSWSCFKSNKDTTPERRTGTIPVLLEDLRRDIDRGIDWVPGDKAKTNAAKNGAMISGATYPADTTRCNEAVESLGFVAFDFDHITPEQLGAIYTRWSCYAAVWYESLQSTEAAPRVRCILPADRPMSPAEYPTVWARLADEAAEVGAQVDTACGDLARAYYTCRRGQHPSYNDGALIRIDELLSRPAKKKIVPFCGNAYGQNKRW